MKIFVIGARGFPGVEGGIESHCEELYPRLVKKGFNITQFVIRRYTKKKYWNGISFKRIPSVQLKTFQKPIYNLIAAIYCIAKRPEIIHVHGLNAGIFIWLFKLFGLKVVATYHSTDYLYPKWNKLIRIILRIFEGQFLLADYIITVSKSYLKHFNEKGRTQRIIYLPNGVNLPNNKNEENKNDVLERWGLQKNGYILTVGRITPEKDFLTLIKAFTQANLYETKLVIVGGYEFQRGYYESLKKISNGNIIFTGQLNKKDLSVLYSNCSLFVLASIYEGLSNALLEAISFNCNILVSDIDSHIEIGLKMEDYFKAKDINDLENKIRKKFSKNEINNYSQFLLRNYNWDIVADEVSKIYLKILNSTSTS